MPNGDSNAILCSRGIFIVGTCPPMKMDTNLLFRQSEAPSVQTDGAFSWNSVYITKKDHRDCGDLCGGEYRDRTGDLLHAMQALSQLS